jgi:hypothetical protein
MSVTFPALVELVSNITGEPHASVANTGRKLREAGYWPKGGFGNAALALKVDRLQTALLIVGLFGATNQAAVAEAVPKFLSLRSNDGEVAIDYVTRALCDTSRNQDTRNKLLSVANMADELVDSVEFFPGEDNPIFAARMIGRDDYIAAKSSDGTEPKLREILFKPPITVGVRRRAIRRVTLDGATLAEIGQGAGLA